MSNRNTASNNEEGEGTRMAMLTPYRMGPFQLSHRVVLSALTRRRSYNHLPQPHAILYYTQRTSPGALLISEATIISHTALGCLNCPGVWSDEQVAAWKPIVQAVHDKGGIFFCQLWHAGRCSSTDIQPNRQVPVSSTNRKVSGSGKYSAPRVLRTEEISMIVTDFRVAARNAVKAGFDGVEIQGAYGFLLDQFMKDGVNDRTDMYGGSLENRCRFTLEVIKEIADEIGSQCVGIRLSPFTDHEDAIDSDPKALGLYMANALSSFNILYAHFVAPRMRNVPIEEEDTSLVPMREAFKGTFMAGGGFNCENGNMVIELGMADVVAYGRWFVSNPDLPRRFALNAPLTPYDQTTLYTSDPFVGYTDYPSLEELQTV